MFVRSIMIPAYHSYVSSPNQSLQSALDIMEEKDIHAMPVVDGEKKFAGMIAKQDIFKAYFYQANDQRNYLTDTKVSEISDYQDVYVTEDEVFENTLTAFNKFSIVAVVAEDGYFLGIISRFDVINQFRSAFGMEKRGLRISITSSESEGRFTKLGDILKQVHANVISITTFDETDKLIRRIILKVDLEVNQKKLVRKLEKYGFKILGIKET